MTRDQLLAIMPCASTRIDIFLHPLNGAMDEFGIDTRARQASFLAQVAHESGQLRYMEEIASGALYEGRKDLGNTERGDGMRFKGRGLIQITGRYNYAQCGAALGLDLLNNPMQLTHVENACRSAAWFWSAYGLNELADEGDQVKISKRINGGKNGLADRLARFKIAQQVLA